MFSKTNSVNIFLGINVCLSSIMSLSFCIYHLPLLQPSLTLPLSTPITSHSFSISLHIFRSLSLTFSLTSPPLSLSLSIYLCRPLHFKLPLILILFLYFRNSFLSTSPCSLSVFPSFPAFPFLSSLSPAFL